MACNHECLDIILGKLRSSRIYIEGQWIGP